jgi:CDP-paratose 2-epimerase
MKVLISGICGFVGSTLARSLVESDPRIKVCGFDNFIRPGSETNREDLKRRGIRTLHADLRSSSDLDNLPEVDWILDAAANPSVLAGVDGSTSPRQLVEHNLIGTLNLLEFCRRKRSGLILLSTSRVYSIKPLASLPMEVHRGAFRPKLEGPLPKGLSALGISESFTTLAPLSVYGSTKLASEVMALEYGDTFSFPVFINRCGVLAGAGQFGRPDQGIFSFWIHSWMRRKPMKYIGFDGLGSQVRDCLHPRDLVPALSKQFAAPVVQTEDRIANFSGGVASACSLRQLSAWCADKLGDHRVDRDPAPRPFDIPWIVLDSSMAERVWDWRPETSNEEIFTEIVDHAHRHPDWLEVSAPF